jgi:glucose 1-dehydrogenase
MITGAAVRIGREIALGLAADGYRVAVHYNSSAAEAAQTVQEIRQAGGVAESFQGDLSDPASTAEALCAAVSEKFGTLDVLINNASLFEAGTLLEATTDQWHRQFTVNLQAPFFLCRSFTARLPQDRRGHIINICDWRGERHPPGNDIYTLTKSGLTGMTQMLARELAPRIQVNGIHPGAILAPPDGDEDHDRRAVETIPLNRTGSPQDIVRAVQYLLRSPFVTGELLNVTGGEHLS